MGLIAVVACGDSGSSSEAQTGTTQTSSSTTTQTTSEGSASTAGTGSTASASTTGSSSADPSESGDSASATSSDSGEDANVYVEPEEIVGGPCAETRAAVSPACDAAPVQEYCRLSDPSDVIMATCLSGGRDQCEVIDDCEAGWHACTATDYVARGGRDVVPDLGTGTNEAWLAACVQDVGDSRFRNEPCSVCSPAEYTPVVQWWCDGEVVYEGGMAGSTLGVVASTQCMRVGENLPGHGANWRIAFADGTPPAVVCCLDEL